MRLAIHGFFLALLGVCSLNVSVVGQSVDGRFVAFNRFGGFDSQDPIQQLIIQMQDKEAQSGAQKSFSDGSVQKAIFFPTTGGMGGTVKILEAYQLKYSRLWKLVLRSPTDKERRFCDFDNFLRVNDGTVDSDEKGEPTMNFYSTQFESWIVFPKLAAMRCVVIESLSDGDVTIRSRNVK